MFGEKIDYHILRPFTHSRNRATQKELDERAARTTFALEDARSYLARVQKEYFAGLFPINPAFSYLDVGCGMGRLSLGLSLAGVHDVTGIDIVEHNIAEALKIADRLPASNRPKFVAADIHQWKTGKAFDVIIVLGAMEHIHDPPQFLKSMARLLKHEGRAFVSFEPFQGPVGDHMSGFFRVQIPWRGLVFSEKALLRLRKERFRPSDPAETFKDVQGGLNQMWYEDYLRYVEEAGLEFVMHNINPQCKHQRKYMPFHPLSWCLTKIPYIRGFFIFSDYSILRLRKQ